MSGGKRLRKRAPEELGLREWVQALLSAVVSVVLVFTFAVRVVRVDGGSMRETLQNGDLLVVVNDCFCGDYAPGEIVVLREKTYNPEPIVKRVIATGGQTVDIDFASGVVYVDGRALDEPYTREPTWTAEGLDFPVTVPEGRLFVMGDNRNNSGDSRDADLGPVDARCVIGRAVFLLLPGISADTGRQELGRIGTIT